MKKRKFKIYLTPAENSIVIQSLNHLRNTMLRENRDTGCLDELRPGEEDVKLHIGTLWAAYSFQKE